MNKYIWLLTHIAFLEDQVRLHEVSGGKFGSVCPRHARREIARSLRRLASMA